MNQEAGTKRKKHSNLWGEPVVHVVPSQTGIAPKERGNKLLEE
jgi:hypothetical protein